MTKNRKKARKPTRQAAIDAKACPFCSKHSAILLQHGVCPCHLTDYNYKPLSLNGVTHRILDTSTISTNREAYLAKMEVLKLSHPKAIALRKVVRAKANKQPETPNSRQARQEFYKSQEWRALRFQVLKEQGARCCLCGTNSDQAIMHVDHIIPLSWDWSLRLTKSNLQVLCEDCNLGKRNSDATDFRIRA